MRITVQLAGAFIIDTERNDPLNVLEALHDAMITEDTVTSDVAVKLNGDKYVISTSNDAPEASDDGWYASLFGVPHTEADGKLAIAY